MARRVFFSFHYKPDVWRANVVRNSWVTQDSAGYIDKAEFESLKRQGDQVVRNWIEKQLDGTSVTVVLIGSDTYDREWVIYEINRSIDKHNGLLGIYIHNIENQIGMTTIKGINPFDVLRFNNGKLYNQYYKTYDWIHDYGYYSLEHWIEEAAFNAGR